MGTVVVTNFVSLDGVIQSPLSPDEDRDGGFGGGGWVPPFTDDAVASFMSETTTGAAALLLGRRSYELFTAAWSQSDPGEPAIVAMNSAPKYVATRSPDTPLPWSNSRRIGDDLPREVAALAREQAGEIVVFGSGELVRELAAHDLVDEYRLLLFPVVLGSGKRMFADGLTPARFSLASAAPTTTGVVMLTYRRATDRRRARDTRLSR